MYISLIRKKNLISHFSHSCLKWLVLWSSGITQRFTESWILLRWMEAASVRHCRLRLYNVPHNVSLVKTSFACICNAWLNICSASKAERKYHSVNCLGIQMCCFLFATHCPKQISPECILFVLLQDGDYETFWQNYKFKCHTLH